MKKLSIYKGECTCGHEITHAFPYSQGQDLKGTDLMVWCAECDTPVPTDRVNSTSEALSAEEILDEWNSGG